MQLVLSINRKIILLCFSVASIVFAASAQENSPYSRYGLGDYFQGQHIINRAMGGLSVAYADGLSANLGQSINFNNPASYANFKTVSYDLGLTIDNRTLRNQATTTKFSSSNFTPSYLALAVPINKQKNIGMAFGLVPKSRVNYAVIENGRIPNLDSVQTVYEGSGGLNQAFIGLGKRWKNISLGFNMGYNFGNKEISTKRGFYNDSVIYNNSNSATNTTFGGTFISGGIQYETVLKQVTDKTNNTENRYILRFGASGNLGQKMGARQDIIRQTFQYNGVGEVAQIDSVFEQRNIKGSVQLPSTYTIGFTIQKNVANSRANFDVWTFGAEYTATQWTKYRFYGSPDALVNSWQVKIGGQFSPNPVRGSNVWSTTNYRAGFFFGKDYINANGRELKLAGLSIGAGLPVRKWRNYDYQFTIINLALEFGKRGSAVNNITENWFRVSVGLSLSDLWFIKRRYD
ncbi:MAG: hypothetical protein ACOVNY_04735 [Chitinophagaceae bacterium]